MATRLLPRTESLQVRSDGRPVKLKDSCEACGRSKVKCSREKPACRRCITHGWPCEYGASHRTGRTSSKAYITPPPLKPRPAADEQQSIINTDRSQTGRTDHDGASSTLAFGEFSSNTGLWTDMGDEDKMMTPSTGSNYDGEVDALWSAYPDAFANRMFGPDQISQIGPVANSQGFRPSEFDDFKFMSNSNSAQSSLIDGSDVLGYDEVASLGSRISNVSESTTGTSCLMSALAMFKHLSRGQTCAISESTLSPSSSTVGTPGTVESVNNNGDNLVYKLQKILECRCSQDEYLASLVTLIVFKALAQRIITCDSATDTKPELDEVRKFQIIANMLVGRLRQIKSRETNMNSNYPGANNFQDNCMAGPMTNVMSAGCLPLPGFSNLAVEQLELELQNRLNVLAAASGRRHNDFGVFGSGVSLDN